VKIGKYSFGIGDRFAHQGIAQINAIIKAKKLGIDIIPVWNKSNREHINVHSLPVDTRIEANAAVNSCRWKNNYFVDADHINLSTVDGFIDCSDFFTLDVANYIGKEITTYKLEAFVENNKKYTGELFIPGISEPFIVTRDLIYQTAEKFLYATSEAGKIYNYIAKKKGADNFVTEVSMDEINEAQTPIEMFFILSALAQVGVPLQTIAPKFTGRFNKGVDYIGDIHQFANEFEQDILVIDFAIKEFGLPDNLKLSIHSGSDKFRIYPVISKIIKKYHKGIHIKTAGTTWLEEMIGLALSGDKPLKLVKSIYNKGLKRMDELCAPYTTVINIDKSKLPTTEEIKTWTGDKFANSLRHIQEHPDYNLNFRQLIHISYKIAAESGNKYTDALKKHSEIIGKQVTENLFERHIKRLFNL